MPAEPAVDAPGAGRVFAPEAASAASGRSRWPFALAVIGFGLGGRAA